MPANKPNIIQGRDKQQRCWWCGDDPLYIRYHDEEWGRPMHDDRTLFEKICLEGFQAGLSWITILRKRENFRQAFDNFDINKVSEYDETDIQRLLSNKGIIRHRGKIEATINNAKCAIKLTDQNSSLSKFIWCYKPSQHIAPNNRDEVQSKSPESEALSKDLKKMGWKFVGPTTMYALMQAMGMVNDHLPTCHIHSKIDSHSTNHMIK